MFKAGWFLGGSGGGGTLIFHGRRYPLSIGGLSAGLVFGASETHFVGTVGNIFRPSDVATAKAGAALVDGGGVVALTNDKGAILHLSSPPDLARPAAHESLFYISVPHWIFFAHFLFSGRQVGVIADLDLSGMAISLC